MRNVQQHPLHPLPWAIINLRAADTEESSLSVNQTSKAGVDRDRKPVSFQGALHCARLISFCVDRRVANLARFGIVSLEFWLQSSIYAGDVLVTGDVIQEGLRRSDDGRRKEEDQSDRRRATLACGPCCTNKLNTVASILLPPSRLRTPLQLTIENVIALKSHEGALSVRLAAQE